MSIPYPIPTWHRDPQEYALEIQRANHDQALSIYGEYAMFCLMWKLEDFDKGLVGRCSECWESGGVDQKIAEAYGQADREKCPTCLGTTFEGGIKARIVRLSLWDPTEREDEENKRGEIDRQSANVQSTSDFRLRTGDFVFRADGSRWRVQQINTNHLRHGFQMTNNSRTPVAFTYGQVMREDEASVAYIIPPVIEDSDMWDILNQPYPADFSDIEEVNGDLLHEDADGGSL